MGVDHGSVHGRANWQFEEQHHDRRDQDGGAGEDQAPLPEDQRGGGQDEQADGRGEHHRQRMVGEGDAVYERGGDEQAIRLAASLRVFRRPPPLPYEEQQEEQRHQGEVEHVRVGVGRQPPEDRSRRTGENPGMVRSSSPVARAIQRIPVRNWTMATVPAIAPAARSAWSKFIRYAASAKGSTCDAMKPRITYAG